MSLIPFINRQDACSSREVAALTRIFYEHSKCLFHKRWILLWNRDIAFKWCNIAVLKKVRFTNAQCHAQCPMPISDAYAQCPMHIRIRNQQSPMPNAQCPMPYAHRVSTCYEKGYISVPTDNANPELRHLFQRHQVRQLLANIPAAESQIYQTILHSADYERKLFL